MTNVNDTPASFAHSEITQEITTITVRTSVGAKKSLRAFTVVPTSQYQNERNAASRSSLDTTTSTAETITVASTETRMEGDDRLRGAQ